MLQKTPLNLTSKVKGISHVVVDVADLAAAEKFYAALGLGFANKFLESWQGAVLAKIAVLVFIIVFIQKRPQGLFAVKGRSVEA